MNQVLPTEPVNQVHAADSLTTRRMEDGATLAPPIPEMAHGILAEPGGHDGPPIEPGERLIVDGNEAAVDVAYRLNELCSIYPITPSSTMAELADEWASHGRTNIYGQVPTVVEMQRAAPRVPCTARSRAVPCAPPSPPRRACC